MQKGGKTLDVPNQVEFQEQIKNLQAALEREISARKKAEARLELKSTELVKITEELQLTNEQIEEHSSAKLAGLGISQNSELNSLLEDEQRNQIKILLDNSSVGMVLTKDGGNGAILANGAACKILGYTEEELKSKNVGTSVHSDDIPQMQKEFHLLHEGEKDEFSIKARLINKGGEIVWTRFSGAAVRDNSGTVKYEVVTFEDITKEKALNDRINLSEILLSNLLADAPIGILMIDELKKVTLANKKFCEIFKLDTTPDQLLGSAASAVAQECSLSTKDPEGFIEKVKLLHGRQAMVLKEEIEFADGRVFERSCMPLSYQDEYKGVLVNYTDITSVKDYRYKLEQQKEKYATIIENMNLGWTETDADGNIIMANKVFCEFSEYSLDELVGKNGVDLFLSETSKEKVEYFKGKTLKAYESQALKIKTKSGKIKHLLVSGLRSYTDKGELIGSLGIQFDITEHKKLELQKEKLLRELESQNEQLNDYAHVVSHDLKSPLRSISALLSWTKEDFAENLGVAGLENLNLIDEKVEKMELLIENILKYSRLDNPEMQNVAIDLNQVIEHTLEMLFIPKNIKVIVAKKLPVIFADGARIQQLFQNLISNAVNHVDKQRGLIEIDFSDTETHYQFAIKDNGTGIKKEYHDKIFTVFKSFDDSDMSTGIGLSIVKKIIDRYEGEIWLESEVDEGTTFFFTLKK